MLVAAYSPLHVLKEQLVRQLERVALAVAGGSRAARPTSSTSVGALCCTKGATGTAAGACGLGRLAVAGGSRVARPTSSTSVGPLCVVTTWHAVFQIFVHVFLKSYFACYFPFRRLGC